MEMTTQKKHLVPKLRFQDFDDEWKYKTVNSFASKLKVGFVGTCEPYYTNSVDGVLLVRTGNLKGVNIELDEEKYVSKEFHEKNKKSQIFPNDLLLARHGGNGEICRVPTGFPEANCLNIVILRTNSEVDTLFFQLAYGTYSAQKQISSVTAGSTQGVINTKEIGRLKISIPKLPEQQKIAGFLTAIDSKLLQLNTRKALLEQYKKGVMQQLFDQTLRFKDDDGRDYADWEEKKLGEVAIFGKGKSISKSDIIEGGNLECIRYGELYTEYKEIIVEIKSRTNLNPKELVLSEKNDVIIPSSGETQIDIATASCVLKDGVALGGDLNIIKSKVNGVFLSYYLNTKKKIDIAKLAQGNSVVHLYNSQLKMLKLELPRKEEQQKIANYLSAIDTKIESVNQQIEKTQAFKKGLLQGMFV